MQNPISVIPAQAGIHTGIEWSRAARLPGNSRVEFRRIRWPDGLRCPYCDSENVQDNCKHKTMPFRCREKGCGKKFSTRTGTALQSSKLGYQKWALAIYILNMGNKGTSSMKLHRDLGITQKSAWHLAHRIRETWGDFEPTFEGLVEADETFVGGREKNEHGDKKLRAGRGTAGKAMMVGVKDRETNCVSAAHVAGTDAATLVPFVTDRTATEATIYTDEHRGYRTLPRLHKTVKHSLGQYVDGQVHTNGIELFWALFKRGYHGTYHRMSIKHLSCYVSEFAGRHNIRPLDTEEQMSATAQGIVGKRLSYSELIA